LKYKYGLKLVGLEINKGINDEYLRVLHGNDVELHVGGADQQYLSIYVNIIKESRGSLCRSCYQLNSPNLTALGCVIEG